MRTPESGKDNNVVRKTSDEIKKGLECCGKGNACRGHCPYDGPENGIKGCTGKLSRDALTLINRLEGDNIAKAIVLEQLEREKKDLLEERELNGFLRDKVKELEAQVPKWISVEERLPEEDGISVLCAVKTYGGTCVCEGYYSKTSNRVWPVDEDVELEEVTHWMPLPSPPEGELL